MKSSHSKKPDLDLFAQKTRGIAIHVDGIVQGVGFRPFIFNQAIKYGLNGWVRNTSAGVDIEIFGSDTALNNFISTLKDNPPPLSQIDNINFQEIPFVNHSQFKIITSSSAINGYQPISPDVAICDDCLEELLDPTDRRYLYPFINCTNCGPRFTIIRDIPYDRPNTTMNDFKMCSDCEREYINPQDRRFHAQPIACPSCGPKIWLEGTNREERNNLSHPSQKHILQLVQKLLGEGNVIAIKGLGGFHLACDAFNSQAVRKLRERKFRIDKPFAVMMPNLEIIQQNCIISSNEKYLVSSRERPILILKRKPNSLLSSEVAPSQNTVGVMLPYTPLHHLLFHSETTHNYRNELKALVMTSGNLSEEPIVIGNDEARDRLTPLVDYFLFHNRPINTRCDDSVIRSFDVAKSKSTGSQNINKIIYPIRRARGYAPNPLRIPWSAPPILATGTELKNTFCFTQGKYAFISQHIGDLENYETYQVYEENIIHYQNLFKIAPEVIAYDLHPDYLATKYALQRVRHEKLNSFAIQHHHAHIAACMVDNQLDNRDSLVLGIAFDGTGYGEDGNIWGGEFLLSNYINYQRLYHLDYCPLPGGEIAIKKPARTALAFLWHAGISFDSTLPSIKALNTEEIKIIRFQLENKINSPLTSSMGRLFDAVASIINVRHQSNYEAQAAIELEAICDLKEKSKYHFEISPFIAGNELISGVINSNILIQQIVDDYNLAIPVSIISAKFHNTLTSIIHEITRNVRNCFGVTDVVLSGGVWQNMTLLKKVFSDLRNDGFQVYIHRNIPTNDGGVSLGQAAITIHRIKS